MLELDASSEEAISGITGYSVSSAITGSLGASTTAGRSWGPHGHMDTDTTNEMNDGTWEIPNNVGNVRNSPDAKLRLRFLSGVQTHLNYTLR